nr:MAG TPA: hypothetical protein [Caudoviricetes sp.]
MRSGKPSSPLKKHIQLLPPGSLRGLSYFNDFPTSVRL